MFFKYLNNFGFFKKIFLHRKSAIHQKKKCITPPLIVCEVGEGGGGLV